jgi:hypothetical protein
MEILGWRLVVSHTNTDESRVSGDLCEKVVSKKRNGVVCRNRTSSLVRQLGSSSSSLALDGRASGIGARSAFPIRRPSVMELAGARLEKIVASLGRHLRLYNMLH